MIDISKIKLVIWDLDDTFWSGTLNEGLVVPNVDNIQLVKDLTDRGIINTICSKNDYEIAVEKLKEFGIWDYFVFVSIDWTPKGNRIAQLIKDIGLKPVNCLFLDDNEVNLNEAAFYSKDLMTALCSETNDLQSFVNSSKKTDTAHQRLNQYKILETKFEDKIVIGDNLAFLYASNMQVQLHNDCTNVADRLFELIHRTNQLNFTKNRCSREEFDFLLSDHNVESGYATVKDKYGDYGIVGFYAMKDYSLIHFLFSCRTIGQGVEQWVYSTLGCPELVTVGEVVNAVEKKEAPGWINQNTSSIDNGKKVTVEREGKIVFKGPCDILSITSFLDINSIIRELTYVGEKTHTTIEHHNHSINYTRFPFLNTAERKELLEYFPFNDEDMFNTHIYDNDVKLMFLSTLPEPSLAVYVNKTTRYKFAWGEWNRPLTDPSLWDFYVNEKSSYNGNITLDWLKRFSDEWEYNGRISVDEYIENLQFVLSHISKSAKLCLILGCEMPFLDNKQDSYIDRHLDHQRFNEAIRKFTKGKQNILLLELSKYINGQEDFINNINHYQRRVYFNIAQDVNSIIETEIGHKIKARSRSSLYFDWMAFKIAKLIQNSSLYKPLRKMYGKIRMGAFTAK